MSTVSPVDPTRCPLCGQRNDCKMTCATRFEDCWCTRVEFSTSVLARVPTAAKALACICRSCAQAGTPQKSSTA